MYFQRSSNDRMRDFLFLRIEIEAPHARTLRDIGRTANTVCPPFQAKTCFLRAITSSQSGVSSPQKEKRANRS
jgi:hypothetical protein